MSPPFLNYPVLLEHAALRARDALIYDLTHERVATQRRMSYVAGDLRETDLRSAVIDMVICTSAREHIGFDNTVYYTRNRRFREHHPADYKKTPREFRRMLRPGGHLFITVPFGRATDLGWFQQFDQKGVDQIIADFDGAALDLSYFKYEPTGWIRSSASDCADCEYFDIRAKGVWDADFPAAARAVVCMELEKPARRT